MKKERIKQLSYALRERLEHMAAYGESKRTYKLRTLDMRRETRNALIRQGVPANEINWNLLHKAFPTAIFRSLTSLCDL